VNWAGRAHRRRRAGLITAGLVLAVLQLPITLPVVPVSVVHDTPIVALNYDAGETIGWPAFVREIATAYRSLPPAQRPATTVLASNYGEAGAVDHFGPADGLPAAYSGHMSFWYWGPPPARDHRDGSSATSASQLTFCGSSPPRHTPGQPRGINDDEQGAPVWICQHHQNLAGHLARTKTVEGATAASGMQPRPADHA
jgi:hypothetical protein